ncbi:39S ribosomal protein L44, mitochondrial-like isoform X2 [Patiria miniata]|uniref:Large ribosomal subunit protein mL44 n=1 Tax=Patiria miniata TaxID=46514 RepID=A0A913ZPX3_PATMI|nr:39S ribosomal protein L44, mitochondrial-like isoform X2 [Patiria miniata]
MLVAYCCSPECFHLFSSVSDVRHHARWFAPFLFALRRQVQAIQHKYGPEEKKPRSHQENWDYDSELYAFGKRVGEDFTDATLRTALTDKSYVEREEARRKEMGLEGEAAKLDIQDNQELAQTGGVFISDYIKAYLRHVYRQLPEEGIGAICEHLTRQELLVYIGRHLGVTDIILCADFPIPHEVASTALQAIVGAIVQDTGAQKAGLFVRDFILSHLVDKDINELWPITNPMGLLVEILEREGRALPEARLLRQVGTSTIMPLYMVGVYSDKKLLGWGPGETLAIAEEEAARVALKHVFGTTENSPPLPLDPVKCKHLNTTVAEEVQRTRLGNQAAVSS